MDLWKNILIDQKTTILDALKVITAGTAQIALVIDRHLKLIGTVTDGDIRTGILAGIKLEEPVEKVMNADPIKAIENSYVKSINDRETLLSLMLRHHIRQLPIVNKTGQVVGLRTLDELLQAKRRENLVVIMSGGAGKRLQPLTNDLPKPMLAIGGKPLLEVNINKLKAQGFERFCLAVGYKAEVIKDYFQDGSKWGVSIQYINEEKPLGTAGALGFLENQESLPFIVMNGDLLTMTRFDNLLDFHVSNKADCTLCVREFDYQLPYGAVEIENQKVISIKEKPSYRYLVNAGMYVLEPSLVNLIAKNEPMQMPYLLEKIISLGYCMKIFPLMEYWSDIGQLTDYEKACREFDKVML